MNTVDVSNRSRIRVAVVFGGQSEEHGISCVTAGSVLRALDPERYDVVPIGITQDGRWVLVEADAATLRIGDDGALPAITDGAAVALAQRGQHTEVSVSAPGHPPKVLGEVDVVFPVLHGPWGEDGTIQGLLEMSGVRYVGSGVLASAVGMDKHYMKVVFAGAGLPILPHVLVSPRGWIEDPEACRESVRSLGFPVFVKPCRAGSSFGISKVHDEAELDAAIDMARQFDPRVLVEAAAPMGAREIECGVIGGLDGSAPCASVVGEITVGGDHEFYDFEAKYLADQATGLHIPAEVTDDVSDRVRALAVAAYDTLGCEGLARVDFFVLHDGRVMINEINTMPGFTPTSMFPQMWAATGVSYPVLVDHLVQLALQRETGLR